MDMLDYVHGRCHLFSIVLAEELGYKIELMMDEYDLEMEREVLVHAYCVDGGEELDIRGFRERWSMEEDFDYNELYYREVSVKDVVELIEVGFLDNFEDGERDLIRKYIHENKEKYIK